MWFSKRKPVAPPFSRRLLDKVRQAALRNNRADISHTVEWLLHQHSEQQMTDAIAQAWRSSSLPLRDWADGITSVRVWLPDSADDLKLQVALSRPAERVVLQDTPLSREAIDRLVVAFPKALPSVVRELALSAPGFSADASSCLLPHHCYENRLGKIVEWVDRMLDSQAKALGRRRAPSELLLRCLMEIANDVYGNWFVLGMDESVWFWDHEEVVGLQRCKASLPELIAAYFENPNCLDDSDFMGIDEASVPFVHLPAMAQEQTGLDRLRKMIRSLTALSCLAIAVRACQREHPSRHATLPSWWTEHATKLDETIEMCRQVCLTGSPLIPSQMHRIEEAIKQAQAAWWARTKALPRNAFPCAMYASLVQAAARGAASLPDIAPAQRAAERCGDGLLSKRESWWPLVFADIEYLLSLNLGPAGTVGRPIPPEFFERPL